MYSTENGYSFEICYKITIHSVIKYKDYKDKCLLSQLVTDRLYHASIKLNARAHRPLPFGQNIYNDFFAHKRSIDL